MHRLAKDAEIKARVDKPTKRCLERMAYARRLDMSDIFRQAIYQYLRRETATHRVEFPVRAR